jgi:hypothetical protein
LVSECDFSADGRVPCSGENNSLFRAEQGIIGNKMELQRKWTGQKAGALQKIPCYSLFSGNWETAASAAPWLPAG